MILPHGSRDSVKMLPNPYQQTYLYSIGTAPQHFSLRVALFSYRRRAIVGREEQWRLKSLRAG